MSERRPHWDDDLTDAVFRALSHTYRAQGWTGGIAIDLDESVYPLIAAVEDWQAEKRRGEAAFSWLMARDARREAVIQRVQGICEVIVENAHQFYEVWDEDPTAAQVPYGQWMVARHILRALDGERDG